VTNATEANQPPGLPGGPVVLWLNRMTLALAVIGGLGTLGIMAIINADVIGRGAFGTPVPATAEIVSAAIVAIVFLQLGDAVRNGRLTRSEGLYNKLCEKKPRLGHILGAFFDLAGAAFFLTIIAGSIPRFVDAWERGYYSGNKGIFVVPVWPVRLILVIGAITVVLVFLGLVMKHIKALRGAPVGDEQ